MARSKAYRWGEDGIAGICDRYQLLVLRPRASGTSATRSSRSASSAWCPSEGNHGEDVKEYYFYLDSHADALVHEVALQVPAARVSRTRGSIEENRRRGGPGPGVRAARHRHLRRRPLLRHRRRVREGDARGHRASASTRVQPRAGGGAAPRPAAPLVPQHLGLGRRAAAASRVIRAGPVGAGVVEPRRRRHRPPSRCRNLPFAYRLGPRYLYADAGGELLFTDNETNAPRVFGAGRVEAASPTSRTRSTATSSTARTAVNPDAARHEGRASTTASRRCRRAARSSFRLRLDAAAT